MKKSNVFYQVRHEARKEAEAIGILVQFERLGYRAYLAHFTKCSPTESNRTFHHKLIISLGMLIHLEDKYHVAIRPTKYLK